MATVVRKWFDRALGARGPPPCLRSTGLVADLLETVSNAIRTGPIIPSVCHLNILLFHLYATSILPPSTPPHCPFSPYFQCYGCSTCTPSFPELESESGKLRVDNGPAFTCPARCLTKLMGRPTNYSGRTCSY